MSDGKYIVEAKRDYVTRRFSNKRKADKYAKSITGPANISTTVWKELPSGRNRIILRWLYTSFGDKKGYLKEV